MRQAYDRDGFLILEGFVPAADCGTLKVRAAELVEAFDPASSHTVFSALTQAHARDAYFRDSGGAIRFFFEDGAFDAAGRLVVPKALALNKIGHALHDLDPVFDRVSRSARFASLAGALGLARPLLLQSMYIFKQPQIGGEVDWHQDATFLYTEPSSVVGFWLALDDADTGNGCLTAIAGAHRGPLRRRFRYRDGALAMETIDTTPWPAAPQVALEVPRGSVVVLHGLLPHASGANTSPRPRHAYSLHVIDGGAHYAADNWLQRPGRPLRGFA
ncbi:MAG: phytanoyl-CoA dioxygenase family protein [Alphaproteobacteria bacterium]|nr:phytanoyl-CoA dioxygenase family protein [Alphaproteobacteria bacterium]